VKIRPSTWVIDLVEEIQREVERTNQRFAENLVSERMTHPIPFFGNLEKAEILTVGLNPAPGEFQNERWPRTSIAAEKLAERLLDYFLIGDFPPHPWFEKWSRALSQVDENFQYQTGRVAHIDLSPRATQVVSQVSSIEVFNAMIRHDLRWLPSLLELAKSARLLFVAGAVNKQKYLIEFLAKYGQEHQISVFRKDRGKRSVGFYELHFRAHCLPVFFSGSGPSARDRGARLAQNISDNRDAILKLSPAWACAW